MRRWERRRWKGVDGVDGDVNSNMRMTSMWMTSMWMSVVEMVAMMMSPMGVTVAMYDNRGDKGGGVRETKTNLEKILKECLWFCAIVFIVVVGGGCGGGFLVAIVSRLMISRIIVVNG